ERAPFRSYDSYAQSFEDYVRFLQDNPRYEGALQRAGDARAFVRELQDAGYATDPKYADKIERILENDVVAALQVPDEGTLT
ncbi:MAG TPA: glucosaminidase domain-containing protein, partial [Alphaproteobacteria bacterium]|nr:glucosaminidase domain-containing protein [Alphaproteobacteria bacterium]